VPVRVNEGNIESIKKLVLNGSDTWPGANYVIRPDGRRKKITELNKEEIANEIAPGYIVERHLQNNDIVLFNRQPSLHRMSLMGHRVKVMPFKTFRLNLSATTPYNADFDGDEMNLHVPQTEEAKVEIENLLMVPKHIRSPRFSGPIIGAVRDHITGLYLLTKDDTRLSREEFTQLVRAVDSKIELPDKDSLSGKEVFSLFLPKDLSIEFKSSSGDLVVIENGRLVKGVIDKVAVGAESGKLINKIEKIYGGEFTKRFIYIISKLAIEFLMQMGFSISISDQDLSEVARREIKEIIEKIRKDVDEINMQYMRGELKLLVGRSPKETLNHMIKNILRNGLNDVQKVLEKYIKDNSTLAMVKSGARGSLVNLVQTAAMVGQEMVMGERIERGYYQRTFPHFKKGTVSLEATGFVSRGFKDGITPFEFFFDAINSRESLMDKSLKTRHSGYMERRLVGALQDLKVEYDGTVRDSANRIIQFLAGEDGLDPSKIEKVGIDVRTIANRL
ncbi:MAG: DNA-directed RNA polymerase subunit A', partial [Candidatus Aenigmatarchaeota archaeon]